MTEEKINRINELARKQKSQGLTPEELEEQKALRREYIDSFKRSLEGQLNNIVVLEEDGSKHKLKKREDE